MKFLVFGLICSLAFTGCNENKKISITRSEAKLSAPTEIFIKKLETEIGNNNDVFQPSEKLITDYGLQKLDLEYQIGGLIETDSNVNEKQILELGVVIGSKSGHTWTMRIPILKIDELSSLAGVVYIQLDEPLKLKDH